MQVALISYMQVAECTRSCLIVHKSGMRSLSSWRYARHSIGRVSKQGVAAPCLSYAFYASCIMLYTLVSRLVNVLLTMYS